MKYTYKKIYKKIENLNSLRAVASAITCAMQGDQSKIQDLKDGNDYIEVMVGGTFYPESGNLEETELYLTDLEVINRNRDLQMESNDYLAGFFGLPKQKSRTGKVGFWTDDIEKNAHIYYIIDGTDIREFLMCNYNEFGFSNQGGIQFIVKDGDDMVDCWLEDGDLLFTDYKEACDYVKKLSSKKHE